MKGRFTLLIALLAMAITAHGDYTISWYTIDGGGETGSGGDYEVLGGFWRAARYAV
jgi:hypothetical protein